jgi:hypothetical protein
MVTGSINSKFISVYLPSSILMGTLIDRTDCWYYFFSLVPTSNPVDVGTEWSYFESFTSFQLASLHLYPEVFFIQLCVSNFIFPSFKRLSISELYPRPRATTIFPSLLRRLFIFVRVRMIFLGSLGVSSHPTHGRHKTLTIRSYFLTGL